MGTPKATDRKNRIAAAADLDAWSNHGWTEGVQIDRMGELETLIVKTYGGVTYEMTTVSGRTGEILVRGGQLFPERTAARLSGASLGSSFLKLRGVYLGFCVELHIDDIRIVTSPVRAIEWVGHHRIETTA